MRETNKSFASIVEIPELKGISGDFYNRELQMLKELMAEKKYKGSLALSDYLINRLENRQEIYPKTKPDTLPSLEKLYTVRNELAAKTEPAEWIKKGLSLLPFPRGPEVMQIKKIIRKPRTGAVTEIRRPKLKSKEITYQEMLIAVNNINEEIKRGHFPQAATRANDLLDLSFFAFIAPKEKSLSAEKIPVSPYERTFVDSLAELKAALLDFMEKAKEFKK